MRGKKPTYKAGIIRLLGAGDLTVAQMASKIPCSVRSAWEIVASLRAAKQVHVCKYLRSKTKPIMVIRLGSGVDAPPLLASSDRVAKHRHKMSADDRDFLNARRRQRNRKIKIDPLTAAFFGVNR